MRKCRTIDLHTSDQIYQMRGRVDDALTASLSSQGAHQDTLRRIEHYSITRLQSSAHSIRSMDSIRTELSRLEAMITSTVNASTSRIEQSEENLMVGSSDANQSHIVIEGDYQQQPTPDQPLSSVPGYLNGQDSRKGSSSASHYSSNGSSILRADNGRKPDALTHPADFHYLVKEQEGISKRFSEISNANESALLYAQFSRDTSPITKARNGKGAALEVLDDVDGAAEANGARLDELNRQGESREVSQDSRLIDERQRSHSARTSVSQRADDRPHGRAPEPYTPPTLDRSATTYDLLEQSLAAAYPSVVAEYLSLQNLTMACQRHISLLEERPSITSKPQRPEGEYDMASAQPHLRLLRDQLEELQDTVDTCMRGCIEAGISRSELENAVALICGSALVQETQQAQAKTETQTQDGKEQTHEKCDDQGDESDAYFSSME